MKKWVILASILLFCVVAAVLCAARADDQGATVFYVAQDKDQDQGGDPLFDDGKGWGPPEVRIKVKLFTDKPSYRVGEQAKIAVVADYDCYFMLYSISSTKQKCVVVPSKFSSYNRLKANKVYYVRDNQGNFLEQKGPAGKETLQVIASVDPIELKKHSKSLDLDGNVVEVTDAGAFVKDVSDELEQRVVNEEKAWGLPPHTTAYTGSSGSGSSGSGSSGTGSSGTGSTSSGHSTGNTGYTGSSGHTGSSGYSSHTAPSSGSTSKKPKGPKPVYGMATVTYQVK